MKYHYLKRIDGQSKVNALSNKSGFFIFKVILKIHFFLFIVIYEFKTYYRKRPPFTSKHSTKLSLWILILHIPKRVSACVKLKKDIDMARLTTQLVHVAAALPVLRAQEG